MATSDPIIVPSGANHLPQLRKTCDALGLQLLELQAIASSLDNMVTSTGTKMTWEELNQLAGLASAQLRLAQLAKSTHGVLEKAVSAACEGGAQ